jgi:hypothetical protein
MQTLRNAFCSSSSSLAAQFCIVAMIMSAYCAGFRALIIIKHYLYKHSTNHMLILYASLQPSISTDATAASTQQQATSAVANAAKDFKQSVDLGLLELPDFYAVVLDSSIDTEISSDDSSTTIDNDDVDDTVLTEYGGDVFTVSDDTATTDSNSSSSSSSSSSSGRSSGTDSIQQQQDAVAVFKSSIEDSYGVPVTAVQNDASKADQLAGMACVVFRTLYKVSINISNQYCTIGSTQTKFIWPYC